MEIKGPLYDKEFLELIERVKVLWGEEQRQARIRAEVEEKNRRKEERKACTRRWIFKSVDAVRQLKCDAMWLMEKMISLKSARNKLLHRRFVEEVYGKNLLDACSDIGKYVS